MKIRFNQPESKNPQDDRGLRIQYSDAKRPGRPWRWYLIVTISGLPLIYLIGLVIWEQVTIEASGRIRVPNFTVRSTVDGYVEQIFVKPLQTVSTGTQLAQLVNDALQNNHDRMQTELQSLENEKKKLLLHTGHYRSGAAQLLKFAQEQKDFAYKRLRQYESLFAQGAVTQAEIATARSQLNAALENLAAHEKAHNQDQNLTPEMRRITQQMSQMTLEFERIQDQVQQLNLVAPAAGLVTELFMQPGEYLGRGQALLEIIFPEQVRIDAFIPPKYQDYAVIGQIVTVKFPNGETVKARIVSVPGVVQKLSSAESNPLEPVRSAILAKMEFVETVTNRLMNGMPVDIYFY